MATTNSDPGSVQVLDAAKGGSGGSDNALASDAASAPAFALPFVDGPKVWSSKEDSELNPARWVVIYPHYVDSTRKISGGRKIAKENAVENPTAVEIFHVVRGMPLRTVLEGDKSYCRDCWLEGRVKVQLFDDDGEPVRAGITKRQDLFRKVAAAIPEHRAKAAKSKMAVQGGGGAGKITQKGTTSAPKKKKKGKR